MVAVGRQRCVERTKEIRRHEQRKDWRSCLYLLSDAHCQVVQLDVVAYGTALCPPRWREAQDLLQHLKEKGLEADLIAFNRGITSCEKATAWQAALRLLQLLAEEEMPPDLISQNSCLSGLATTARWRLAAEAAEAAVGVEKADLITYDALMSACQKGDQWSGSLKLLNKLKTHGLTPEAITFNVAISACRDHWRRAADLLPRSRGKSRGTRTRVTYNAAMSALEEHWQISLGLLEESRNDGLQPSLVTYGSFMSACEGQWPIAMFLLDELIDNRLQPNLIVMNACMSAYEKCSQWQRALSLFDASQRAFQVDDISYTAAFSALQQGGGWLCALQLKASGRPCLEAAVGQAFPWHLSSQLLQSLRTASGRASTLSSTLMLSAMAEALAWSRAMHVYVSTQLPGNLGNLIWSNAAMVANGRVSRWRGVLQLLGSTRDATSYHEAASSCELGGQSLLGLGLLSELQNWTLRRLRVGTACGSRSV